MRIALFYTCSCYSAHAFQGYRDGRLGLFGGFCFGGMASCSLALYAALARVFTQPVSEETIDESVESLYGLRLIVLSARYHRYILTYSELIF